MLKKPLWIAWYLLCEGDLLWRDTSSSFVLRDAFGLDAFLSRLDDSLNVIVSFASDTSKRAESFRHFSHIKKTVGEQNKKADKRRRCMAVTCSSFKIPKLCENSQLRCEQVWCHLHPFKFVPLKRRDLQTKVCCTLGRWCTVQSFKGWCNVSLYRYYMKASQ